MHEALRRTTMSLLALTLGACGDPAGTLYPHPDPSSDVVRVTAVRVLPQTLHFTAIGQTGQVRWMIAPSDATDQGLRWESTDTTVATVDEAGLVTARGAGLEVLVTAYTHDGEFQSSVNVSVSP